MDISINFPKIFEDFDKEKNNDCDITKLTNNTIVWWICKKGHNYRCSVSKRIDKSCYYCNRFITNENNLEKTHPYLIPLWDPNNKIKMTEVSSGSDKIVSWLCPKNKEHTHNMKICSKVVSLGTSCIYCSGKKVNSTNCAYTICPEICKEWDFSNNLTPYQISSGSNYKIIWRCSKNGEHIYTLSIKERKRGRNCPFCKGRQVNHTNHAAFPYLLEEWDPINKLTLYQVSKTSHVKMKWICKENSSHKWTATIAARRNTNCPYCKISKGEQKIEQYLVKNKILFEREKQFDDLKNIRNLRVDFYIELFNLIIEYDGEQHFKPMRRSHNKEKDLKKFENTQLHDQIKNDYCKKNKMNLLRIPYTVFNNIEKIIDKYIDKFYFI